MKIFLMLSFQCVIDTTNNSQDAQQMNKSIRKCITRKLSHPVNSFIILKNTNPKQAYDNQVSTLHRRNS